MRKNLLFISAFIVLLNYSYADVCSTGWIIFRKLQSPKPKPLTTVAAVRGDLSGVLYNPSVLATIGSKELFTLAETGISKDIAAGIVYGHLLDDINAISVGILNYNTGKEKLYYIEGGVENEREVVAQNDYLVFLSYGRRVIKNKLTTGGTVKFAISNMAEIKTAQAYALDIGGLYYFREDVIISLAVQNLGTTTKFIEKQERLPQSVLLGLGYTKIFTGGYYLYFASDITYMFNERRTTPTLGVEIGKFSFTLFLGYRFNVEEWIYTIGAGFAVKNFDVKYSYTPSLYLNSVHRISLGVKF